ncbi:MAG: hypothetical protein IJ165_05155 [Proteobacteria bacterium]|nr:hypothetical protein [Pseudomonadota bacterium]
MLEFFDDLHAFMGGCEGNTGCDEPSCVMRAWQISPIADDFIPMTVVSASDVSIGDVAKSRSSSIWERRAEYLAG